MYKNGALPVLKRNSAPPTLSAQQYRLKLLLPAGRLDGRRKEAQIRYQRIWLLFRVILPKWDKIDMFFV